jgi:membrane protease YdiL (CAAX protease family)
VFFIAAIVEEVGWTGYMYESMLKRWSALKTGILIGAIWGIWHVIPLIQADNNPIWIIWQVITSIFNRILMVWIYNNSSKNIFLGVIYHMMINVSVFLFPNYGSHYNPVITSIILGIVTTIVTFLWGSKTLAQYRLSKR